jgi:hypothetical protein
LKLRSDIAESPWLVHSGSNQHSDGSIEHGDRVGPSQSSGEMSFLTRITTKAGEIARFGSPIDEKKPGNYHYLSIQARINVQTATINAGIEARKVTFGEKRLSSWRQTLLKLQP